MGAFFLYNKILHLSEEKIINFFQKKYFTRHFVFETQDYKLFYFPKISIDKKHFYKKNNLAIIGLGTFIIDNKIGEDVLKKIYEQIINNNFDVTTIKGDFLIIFISFSENKIFLYPCPSYTYNVYHDDSFNIITNSFLSIIEIKDDIHYNINKLAIAELLTTGNLIGPDTIFNEIKRLEKITISNNKNIIIKHKSSSIIDTTQFKSIKIAFNYQIDKINDYFNNIKRVCVELGVTLGLTGGLDSRLLLSIYLNNNIKPKVFYNYKNINFEHTIVQQIIMQNNLDSSLNVIINNDNLKTIENSFYFNDGIIRTHQIWYENIKTYEFLNNLMNDKKINSTGIGGEIFRNNEHLNINKIYNLELWIIYELLFKYTGLEFPYSKKILNNLVIYIKEKIKKLLEIDKDKIDYILIKRYYNEIYNPANRTIRNNIENQSHYFLSPFTDFSLTQSSYRLINFLKNDFDFEIQLLKYFSNSLSNIPLHYGFIPVHGIPFKIKLQTYFKKHLPLPLFYGFYKRYKKYYYKTDNSINFINNDLFTIFNEFNLELNFDQLIKSNFLSPLLYELAYFLNKYKNKFKC